MLLNCKSNNCAQQRRRRRLFALGAKLLLTVTLAISRLFAAEPSNGNPKDGG